MYIYIYISKSITQVRHCRFLRNIYKYKLIRTRKNDCWIDIINNATKGLGVLVITLSPL